MQEVKYWQERHKKLSKKSTEVRKMQGRPASPDHLAFSFLESFMECFSEG